MGAINPYTVSFKTLERYTIKATTAIAVGRCVDFNDGQVTVAGAPVKAIADVAMQIGEFGAGATDGSTVAEVGAAIAAAGLPLTPDATGRLIPATTGQQIFARSQGTATAAGQYIEVQITKEGKA